MSDRSEAATLDAEILRALDRWHRHGIELEDTDFDDLALRIFAYQLRTNEPYARYCASLGVSTVAMPTSWRAIPAVPAAAFKDATIATFDVAEAALAFETSGTTQGVGGRHYMQTRALYDAALLAGFDRFVLPDDARLRYLNLVPNPADRPQSSLGHMMARVCADRGDGQTGWYVRGSDIFLEAFLADADLAIADARPVCIAATAFALVHVLDTLVSRDLRLALPHGSRVMETGGFKGRTRVVERDDLYAQIVDRLGIPSLAVVAEYGMTELTSQYYDTTLRHAPAAEIQPSARRKAAQPTLRTRVVAPSGADVPDGTVGALVHVDLANRSSCLAIATEDVGVRFPDGLVLIGREAGAALRGCSLDAETLLAR